MFTHVFYSPEHKAIAISITAREDCGAVAQSVGITAWLSPEQAKSLKLEIEVALRDVPREMTEADLMAADPPEVVELTSCPNVPI